MSKIICDICGTSYPETAKQCPICGFVRPGDVQRVTSEVTSNGSGSTGYTHVKGGHFSKSNVKKRVKDNAHTTAKSKADAPKNNKNTEEKDNRGLVITAVVLLLAVIGVVIYIAIRFFGPISDPNDGSVPSTGSYDQSQLACTDIKLDTDTLLFEMEGEARLLNVTVEPKNTSDAIKFSSENESVVTVNKVGKITVVGEGTTNIVITCGKVTKKCAVTVQYPEESTGVENTDNTENTSNTEGADQPQETLRLVYKDITLSYAGEIQDMYSGKIARNLITWSSDNETVATFVDGKVKAVGSGMTTIHAEYAGQKASCIIRCSFTTSSGVAGSGGVSEDGGGSSTSAITGTITVNGVNVRSGPDVSSEDVGDLNANEKVTITETKQGVDGRTWGKIGENRWVSMEFVKTN